MQKKLPIIGLSDPEPAPTAASPLKVYTQYDFPQRNFKPFIPTIDGSEDIEAKLRGLSPEVRRAKVLAALGLSEEHCTHYAPLDPKDPEFGKKFNSDLFFNEPRYIIESFMKIDTMAGGELIPFLLNEVQLAYYFNRSFNDLILKARQFGVTTLITALWLLDAMYKKALRAVIVSYEKEAAEIVMSRARQMYYCIPENLRPPLSRESLEILEFEGMSGSCLQIVILKKQGKKQSDKSSVMGRGKTIHRLLLTEPAFYEGVEEKDLSGLLGAVHIHRGGQVAIESTPNGASGFFYRECKAAEQRRTNRKLFKLKWPLDPKNDEAWKQARQRERIFDPHTSEGRRNWAQEFDCSFLASANIFFPPETWAPTTKFQRIPKDIVGTDYPAYVFIFQEPDPDDFYVIGADTAKGLERGDNCSGTVLSRTHRTEVAQIWGKLSPDQFAQVLEWVGYKYNEAFIGVENEKDGAVTVHVLEKELGYRNLYYHVNEYARTPQSSSTPGWTTNSKTRPVMLNLLRKSLVEESIFLSFPYREVEMATFWVIDGKPQAPEGETDDTLISAAIAHRLLDFPEAIVRIGETDLEVRHYG